MSRYLKAITAFFTSLGTWGVTVSADGEITQPELWGLAGVLVVTFGVFQAPNDTPKGQPPDPEMSEREPERYRHRREDG